MTGPSEHRLFSVAEADALIPVVAPLMAALQEALTHLRAKHRAAEDLARAPKSGNGHRLQEEAALQAARTEIETLSRAFQRDLEVLERCGCEVKDVDAGLLDFRSLRDGEVVYLCWRSGEERITHWHTLDSGFAGRQPL
jgi:hypothetical protein